MPLLGDKALVALIQKGLITTFKDKPRDWYDKDSPVQPSSIDFHIGKIFVPEVRADQKGGINNPKTASHNLPPGGTVLVESSEDLNIPSDIAGFGSPPADIAAQGILMTNAGHIDPGFKGRLTFTLINMGKEPFTIRCGVKIFTTLWFQLSNGVEKNYYNRNQLITSGAKDDTIDLLSKDFLNVERRAKKIATTRFAYATFLATILAAAISASAYWVQNKFSNSTDLARKIAVLETKVEERKPIGDLEKSINALSSRLNTLENKVGAAKGTP